MNKEVKTQVVNGKTWTNQFPKKEGEYWFYGYRYGKISCGYARKPELMRLKVRLDGNKNPMYIAEGHFMWQNEVEDAWFTEIDPIEFPKLSS